MPAKQKTEWRTRLGPLMEERRVALRLLWTDVADRSGLTTETLRTIRTSTGGIRALTKRGIEEALQWAPGSIDRILAGGDPIEVAHVTATTALALTAHARATAIRPTAETTGQSAHDGDTVTLTETASVRRFPGWFTSELERRGLNLNDLDASVQVLRDLAAHNRYTLAELLLNAGLADEDDLAINERPTPPRGSEALAEFDEGIRRAASSPFLSRRERKEIEAFAAQVRQEAIEKHLSDE